MSGRASRDKGRRAEYEVRDLMKRITGVEYIRTPLSGGLHQTFPWDVMPKPGTDLTLNPLQGVGIEVKHWDKISMPEWIQQCRDAELDFVGFEKNRWTIFFKNKARWYVTMPVEYFEKLVNNQE